ncbi:TPA: peptide deformylase [Streptococcus agalactiae]|jgi:N-formylmethionyl-tRNA deformylase|uniref:Polypeptide deformylase, putative n=2 Tax=Streptococcus agalactiae TaxID=1311 RepID=Q8DYY8_STRA5|nr:MULTISPECIES: peptide deformylase [Streptococcus]AAN00205.1 polypeptide deformylase, putative [Streptococcus agalactiae 2603V/R]AIF88848.1 peptide deformylase [Streptococcus agalactiae]AIX05021.1 polypeptide deformylase family protein [Streptococcus agalactiae CNCTC 10/84]AYY68456.1 peptide deformylase [Streptococcus sp. FDAARGOS_521]EPT55633.1 peptide deformylase [Streptococcus agalactiae CCUG 25532]
MIKPIVRDTFFLQQKSQMASRADVSLAKDLQETLHANQNYCVGMAANMIGSLKRVIIINVGITNLVMFNPVVVAKSDPYETEESCLSLVGCRSTQRYCHITISYRDINWKEQQIKLTDFPAQICQHELDHLEGILI